MRLFSILFVSFLLAANLSAVPQKKDKSPKFDPPETESQTPKEDSVEGKGKAGHGGVTTDDSKDTKSREEKKTEDPLATESSDDALTRLKSWAEAKSTPKNALASFPDAVVSALADYTADEVREKLGIKPFEGNDPKKPADLISKLIELTDETPVADLKKKAIDGDKLAAAVYEARLRDYNVMNLRGNALMRPDRALELYDRVSRLFRSVKGTPWEKINPEIQKQILSALVAETQSFPKGLLNLFFNGQNEQGKAANIITLLEKMAQESGKKLPLLGKQNSVFAEALSQATKVLHIQHYGQPKLEEMLTDSEKSEKWKGYSDAFGTAAVAHGNSNNKAFHELLAQVDPSDPQKNWAAIDALRKGWLTENTATGFMDWHARNKKILSAWERELKDPNLDQTIRDGLVRDSAVLKNVIDRTATVLYAEPPKSESEEAPALAIRPDGIAKTVNLAGQNVSGNTYLQPPNLKDTTQVHRYEEALPWQNVRVTWEKPVPKATQLVLQWGKNDELKVSSAFIAKTPAKAPTKEEETETKETAEAKPKKVKATPVSNAKPKAEKPGPKSDEDKAKYFMEP